MCSSDLFGKFTIIEDQIAPETSKPFFRKDDFTGKSTLVIPVVEELSGLASYQCYKNRKWQCVEYHSLDGELLLNPTGSNQQGKYRLNIILQDKAGNIRKSKFKIINTNPVD